MTGGLSLRHRLLLGMLLSTLLGLLLGWGCLLWLGPEWLWLAVVAGLLAALGIGLRLTRTLGDSLAGLEIGMLNLIDRDFSVSLPDSGINELDRLAQLFNEASARLRQERQHIYQRELLLDKVIQNSPNIMLLCDSVGHIIYANDAAKHLFNARKGLEGSSLSELKAKVSEEMRQMLESERDGLFNLGLPEGENQSWHQSRGQFNLNGQQHQLLLLKQMTRELNRQEVAVWKKVIRVISHELNNSLAPIASMVNSGRRLTTENRDPKLSLIFDTIENRTNHLGQFIEGYARFAKLPSPRKHVIPWARLLPELAEHYAFVCREIPTLTLLADEVQLEQVLLNLLKNAHESGSAPEEIELQIASRSGWRSDAADPVAGVSICVMDRGSGMSAEVLSQALLPFYSTKPQGSGLGLALCREIAEAHDGRLSLQNRQDGGFLVQLWLPQQ
ncbi:sensor histidine kinase [Shewanella algae]|uniref:sensor histidine kinase n=1 Tax=Shewanella algae TaxID=38313 RepID=UPI001AAD6183|nr:ATP-binding protein [Shewanella algae]MBO2617584.1 histidine kinase [Shewanella algae]